MAALFPRPMALRRRSAALAAARVAASSVGSPRRSIKPKSLFGSSNDFALDRCPTVITSSVADGSKELRVQDSSVYWLTPGTGTDGVIYRVAKP
jgi:hypothetical protein